MTNPPAQGRTMVVDVAKLDSVELASRCGDDVDNAGLWSEFLRRFTAKIKTFIRGTLRQSPGGTALLDTAGFQENDLFQSTIVRLVENDCAALKRFSGATEAELLAYFAVIARSTVRDFLRRQSALKRSPWQQPAAAVELERIPTYGCDQNAAQPSIEREILGRELAQLGLRAIRSYSGECSARDRLIFELYFFHGLSAAQIAECKGIELSKTGVEKTLNRLKDRVRTAAEARLTEAMQQ